MGGQLELQLVEQQRELGFGLGIAGESELAAVGNRQVQIDHLHGGELLDDAARREARCQGVKAARQRDMEAICQEGDEDMRLNAGLDLVIDRPDGEVAPRLRRGKLLRFLKACSTRTSSRYKFHSLAGSSSVRLVRKR